MTGELPTLQDIAKKEGVTLGEARKMGRPPLRWCFEVRGLTPAGRVVKRRRFTLVGPAPGWLVYAHDLAHTTDLDVEIYDKVLDMTLRVV